MRESFDELLMDHRILEWILKHTGEIHCKEMIAGNFEDFIVPATRQDINREINRGTSLMLGQCTCSDGMCGCLRCWIHGMPKAISPSKAKFGI